MWCHAPGTSPALEQGPASKASGNVHKSFFEGEASGEGVVWDFFLFFFFRVRVRVRDGDNRAFPPHDIGVVQRRHELDLGADFAPLHPAAVAIHLCEPRSGRAVRDLVRRYLRRFFFRGAVCAV